MSAIFQIQTMLFWNIGPAVTCGPKNVPPKVQYGVIKSLFSSHLYLIVSVLISLHVDPNGTTTGDAEEATRGLDDPLTFLDDVVATADPAQHENFTNVEESTDIPQPASSEEGVFSERVFTSDAPSDEDQGTATTQVTSVLLPDDSTGSGIQPTSEEPEVTQPTEFPVSTTEAEPEQQTPEPEPEPEPKPEPKPEPRPDTVNTGQCSNVMVQVSCLTGVGLLCLFYVLSFPSRVEFCL